MKLRPNRGLLSPECSVIFEGDGTNLSPLINNTTLSEVGLEIKADLKLNPRLAIHDIPVELTGDTIANCISQQNFSDAAPE